MRCVLNINGKYSINELKVLRRAYIDYKQLERQLSIDLGDTSDIQKAYKYIDEMRKHSDRIGFTNVELDEGYFDFNYNDMCLTISKYNLRGVCKLAESIEIWSDDSWEYLGTFNFNELEKIILGY